MGVDVRLLFFEREKPMRIQRHITRFIAVSLAVLMLGATVPVSAAEIAAPANIGSVSAVGSVQLRGVGVSEGTLFSGDRLNVAPGGYAKVVLGSGAKVEVDGSSDVTVSKDANAINIQMTSGNIAFTGDAQKPVRVRVGVYEITTTKEARGSVAFVGSEAFGVRVMDGTVSVRNTSTKQSYTVTKADAKIFSLRSDSNQSSGVLLASTAPTAIPPAPAMPARRQLSGGAKTALIVTAVLGSAAAIAVLMTKNDDTDADAAARLRATTASTTAANTETAVVAAAVASTQVDNAAIAANTAITNAPVTASFTAADKLALQNRANTLSSQAKASKTSLAALQIQLDTLQGQLENASPSTVAALESQIKLILDSTNAEVNKLNSYIADLNKLVADANAEVPNLITAPTIQPVAPAQPAASGSNPV